MTHTQSPQACVLDVNKLDISYGNVKAVEGVSLRLQAGTITTVIGPNGAGKTTLLSAIMGLCPAKVTCLTSGNRSLVWMWRVASRWA